MLTIEIKEYLGKWREPLCSWIGSLPWKTSVFPRLINKFKAIPTKMPARFYVYLDKAAFLYMEKLQF